LFLNTQKLVKNRHLLWHTFCEQISVFEFTRLDAWDGVEVVEVRQVICAAPSESEKAPMPLRMNVLSSFPAIWSQY
jgi:hypothetical protein